MSTQMLLGGAAAAIAAAAVYHQERDHHTVSSITNGTKSHLRWNLCNIKDGMHDDLISFKDALMHMLTFQSRGSIHDQRYGYGGGMSNSGSSWSGRGRDFDGSQSYFSGESGGDSRVGWTESKPRTLFGGSSSSSNGGSLWRGQRDSGYAGREPDIGGRVEDLKHAGAELGRDATAKVQQTVLGAKDTVTGAVSGAARDVSNKSQSILNWGADKVDKSKDAVADQYHRVAGGLDHARDAAHEQARETLDAPRAGLFGRKENRSTGFFGRKEDDSAFLARRQEEHSGGWFGKRDDRHETRRAPFGSTADHTQSRGEPRTQVLLSKSSEEQLVRKLDQAQHELVECKNKLESISSDVRNYSSSNHYTTQSHEDTRSGGLFGWLRRSRDADLTSRKIGPVDTQRRLDARGGDDWYRDAPRSADDRYVTATTRPVRGWGDTADMFAQEELEEERRRANKFWRSN